MFDTSLAHKLLRESRSFVLGVACFLSSRLISFNFSCDLDIWAQGQHGQGLRSFFIGICFATI